MKYLVWILALFAAAVALAIVAQNPGYVLLVYPPYRIELSLTLFAVLLLLAFVSGYALLRLAFATLHLPGYVRKFRRERSQAQARKLMDEALIAFFEVRYADAELAATRAMQSGKPTILLSVIAARSAHELRDYPKRDSYLSVGGGKTGGDATLRLITSAKFMLDQGQPRAALNALQELRDGGVKNHPGAHALELKAQMQAGNWDEALRLLDQLEKRATLDAETAGQLRQQAWLGKIDQQQGLASLTAILKNIPADFKRRSKVAATAARALMRQGGYALARQLLADSLNAHWDSDLVALFGDCLPDSQSGDGVAQIEQAEKWLAQHKQDPGLLLALGKLCLQQKLWGKARSYLDASISISPSHAAYTALAQLAQQMKKPEEAFKYYQSAMGLVKP